MQSLTLLITYEFRLTHICIREKEEEWLLTLTVVFWRPKLKTTGIEFPLQVCHGRCWCCRGEGGCCWTRHGGGWRHQTVELYTGRWCNCATCGGSRYCSAFHCFWASITQEKVQRKNKYGNMVSCKKNISSYFFQSHLSKRSIYIKSNGPLWVFTWVEKEDIDIVWRTEITGFHKGCIGH